MSEAAWDEADLRERRRVAVHEAGHAIAAVLIGGEATVRLSIMRDSGGVLRFYGLTTARGDAAFDHGLVAASGPVAEWVAGAHMGWPEPPASEYAADRANVSKAAELVAPGNLLAGRVAIFERALRALAEPRAWRATVAVANALMDMFPDEAAACGARGRGDACPRRRVNARSTARGGSIGPSRGARCLFRRAATRGRSRPRSPETRTRSRPSWPGRRFL